MKFCASEKCKTFDFVCAETMTTMSPRFTRSAVLISHVQLQVEGSTLGGIFYSRLGIINEPLAPPRYKAGNAAVHTRGCILA